MARPSPASTHRRSSPHLFNRLNSQEVLGLLEVPNRIRIFPFDSGLPEFLAILRIF